MDRFFVDSSQIDLHNNLVVIDGEDVKHIASVLRLKSGEKIEICDGFDNEYICEIAEVTKVEITARIIEKVNITREPRINIIAYQGIPKGQKTDFIVQKLTEIGVSEIVLVDTDRTVSKIDKKSDKKIDRWQKIAYEASKQSKRGIIPKVRGPLKFDEALDDMNKNDFNIFPYEQEHKVTLKSELKKISKELGIRSYKLDMENIESKKESNESTPTNAKNPRIGFFIGPEGGFSDEEIKKILGNGNRTVTFGNRILRTETAGIYIASIIIYELEMEEEI